jgi:hypothetical protein
MSTLTTLTNKKRKSQAITPTPNKTDIIMTLGSTLLKDWKVMRDVLKRHYSEDNDKELHNQLVKMNPQLIQSVHIDLLDDDTITDVLTQNIELLPILCIKLNDSRYNNDTCVSSNYKVPKNLVLQYLQTHPKWPHKLPSSILKFKYVWDALFMIPGVDFTHMNWCDIYRKRQVLVHVIVKNKKKVIYRQCKGGYWYNPFDSITSTTWNIRKLSGFARMVQSLGMVPARALWLIKEWSKKHDIPLVLCNIVASFLFPNPEALVF